MMVAASMVVEYRRETTFSTMRLGALHRNRRMESESKARVARTGRPITRVEPASSRYARWLQRTICGETLAETLAQASTGAHPKTRRSGGPPKSGRTICRSPRTRLDSRSGYPTSQQHEPNSKRRASSSSPRRGTRASATSPHLATRTATRSSSIVATHRGSRASGGDGRLRKRSRMTPERSPARRASLLRGREGPLSRAFSVDATSRLPSQWLPTASK